MKPWIQHDLKVRWTVQSSLLITSEVHAEVPECSSYTTHEFNNKQRFSNPVNAATATPTLVRAMQGLSSFFFTGNHSPSEVKTCTTLVGAAAGGRCRACNSCMLPAHAASRL